MGIFSFLCLIHLTNNPVQICEFNTTTPCISHQRWSPVPCPRGLLHSCCPSRSLRLQSAPTFKSNLPPHCPYFGLENPPEPQFGVDSKIQLEFVIDAQNRLTINDFPVFPHDMNAAASSPFVVTTRQIRREDGQETDPVQMDFAFETLQPINSVQDPAVTVLPTRFTVLGLQGHPVKVDTIAIDLLQTPDQTAIARFVQIPFEQTPGATTCDPSAKWSLCRLRAIIAARLQNIMS